LPVDTAFDAVALAAFTAVCAVLLVAPDDFGPVAVGRFRAPDDFDDAAAEPAALAVLPDFAAAPPDLEAAAFEVVAEAAFADLSAGVGFAEDLASPDFAVADFGAGDFADLALEAAGVVAGFPPALASLDRFEIAAPAPVFASSGALEEVFFAEVVSLIVVPQQEVDMTGNVRAPDKFPPPAQAPPGPGFRVDRTRGHPYVPPHFRGAFQPSSGA
jgi:hypothetical protein